jgi:hypothetical protein
MEGGVVVSFHALSCISLEELRKISIGIRPVSGTLL